MAFRLFALSGRGVTWSLKPQREARNFLDNLTPSSGGCVQPIVPHSSREGEGALFQDDLNSPPCGRHCPFCDVHERSSRATSTFRTSRSIRLQLLDRPAGEYRFGRYSRWKIENLASRRTSSSPVFGPYCLLPPCSVDSHAAGTRMVKIQPFYLAGADRIRLQQTIPLQSTSWTSSRSPQE